MSFRDNLDHISYAFIQKTYRTFTYSREIRWLILKFLKTLVDNVDMIIYILIVILAIIYGLFLFCALSQKKYKIALPGYFLIGSGLLFLKFSPQFAIKTHINKVGLLDLTVLADRIYNLYLLSYWIIGIGLALSFFANLYITFRFRVAIFPFLWKRNNQ